MDKLRIKQKREMMDLLRTFFTSRDFFELETPLLVPSPGMEVHLHSFSTQYVQQNGLEQTLHLPTSPEFAIKKALGAGYDKVFEIARVFRNQGELGTQHHPEFNMLEWYRPGSYLEIMDDVEALLKFIGDQFSDHIHGDEQFWKQVKRTPIKDCFQNHADLDLNRGLRDPEYWRVAATKALGEVIPEDDDFEDIFFRIWLKCIEPQLGQDQPEIVYDYPASMAALSKLKPPDEIWAERFELYIRGIEIGNAFSELTDSVEQIRRFDQSNQHRKQLGYLPHPMDEEFIHAVGKMSATGGIAIGVERLLMALTGEADIRRFFLYPLGDAQRK